MLVVALFAITEVFFMISDDDLHQRRKIDAMNMKIKLTFTEFRKVIKQIFSGSILGSTIGIIPGLGSSASSWFGYIAAKKLSKKPNEFGKGNPEGIVGPESANNATVGGALLPLLTLGIPGSASLAIIAGAFIIHGIQPGPQLFSNNTELVNGIFIGFVFTSIGMFLMGKVLTSAFARVVVTPNSYLVPAILIFSLIGVYVSTTNYTDLWLALILGVIAYYLRRFNYSVYSFVLAFVLSPIMEVGLRRALDISGGSYAIFFSRPYSLLLIGILLIIIISTIAKSIMNYRKNMRTSA